MMTRSIRLACAAFVLLAGCAVKHLPDVGALQPAAYRYHASADGIDVAVDPYIEEQRLVEYFGTNLLSKGILPVHLVIRNGSGSTYMFDPRDVSCSLAIETAETPDGTPAQGQAALDERGTEHQAAGEAAGTVAKGMVVGGELVTTHALEQTHSFTAPGAAAGLGIGLGGALFAWAVDHEVQKDEVSYKSIARKQIFEKTLFGGETHSGFVYFKDKDGSRLADLRTVVVRLVEKKTSRAIMLAVPIR